MSKTFKSIAEESVRTITAFPAHVSDGRFRIELEEGKSIRGIILAATDAPAIALAILEAAGITDKGFTESNDAELAVAHLTSHVGLERANAKAAADREALEGEALEIANVWRDAHAASLYAAWVNVTSPGVFLAMARKAREIHGAPKC